MKCFPDAQFRRLLEIELPIIQAPMAGAAFADMVIAVSEAGGLGSLACGMLTTAQMREEISLIRQGTSRPINVNFFCHEAPRCEPEVEAAWERRLAPYYHELNVPFRESQAPTSQFLSTVSRGESLFKPRWS